MLGERPTTHILKRLQPGLVHKNGHNKMTLPEISQVGSFDLKNESQVRVARSKMARILTLTNVGKHSRPMLKWFKNPPFNVSIRCLRFQFEIFFVA